MSEARVFVKGHVAFSSGDAAERREYKFVNRNVSAYGVMGLPAGGPGGKSDLSLFGNAVDATIRIADPEGFTFRTRAVVLRERTAYASSLGLRFQLDAETRARLEAHVKRHGFYPTEYLRKYPRIPSLAVVQTYPLRVLATLGGSAADKDQPLIFDVGNLSPNGILIFTENQLSLELGPGDLLDMVLEPRGWFPMQVRVQGMICRVIDDRDPSSGNLVRSLGIKFTAVDDANRSAFLDLLKDILERLKGLGLAP